MDDPDKAWETPRNSEVSEATVKLSNVIGGLFNSIDSLEKRLESVLVPDSTKNNGCEREVRAAQCKLAFEIGNSADRVLDAQCRIDALIKRVEV